MSALTKEYKIKHIFTTAYHPQGNGQVERTNRTIKGILGKLVIEKQTDWDLHLDSALFAYRTTRSQSTGFTPSELLYGHQIPRRRDLGVDRDEELEVDPLEFLMEEFTMKGEI